MKINKYILTEAKEDIEKFKSKFGEKTYNDFIKAKDRLKNKNISTDLTYHIKNTSPEKMSEIIQSLYNKEKDKQRLRQIQGKDKEIRGKYKDFGIVGNYHVYQPLDYISSMDLGVNTGWCTTGRYGHAGKPDYTPSANDAKKHFNEYKEDGAELYYFLNPETMYGEIAIAKYEDPDLQPEKISDNQYIIKPDYDVFDYKDNKNFSLIKKIPQEFLDKVGLKPTLINTVNVGGFIFNKKTRILMDIDKKAEELVFPKGFNLPKNCYNLFALCEKAKSIDLSNADTSKVTDMYCMFYYCLSLKSLDLSNFDTSRVTNMSDMFSNCRSLEYLDLSSFDTSNVTDMYGMFSNCRSLKSLELSSFDTSKVTDMRYMFEECYSLTSVKGIKIPKNADTHSMFAECPAGKEFEKKYNIKENLDEASVRKNTHQQHMESLVMFGDEGLKEINYKLDNYIKSFDDKNNNLNISTKIDEAPAVQIYSHIGQGYPDNGIGLKSLLSSPDNAITTDEQIEAKYNERPNMVDMLKFCLRLSKSIPAGEIWQGDCLFTSNTKKEVKIGNKDCIVFQPNKVVYSFSEDNPNYEKIKSSSFGICFHTIYKKNKDNISQSFKVDLDRLSNVPEDIYIMSPAVNYSKVGFDTKINKELLSELNDLENKLFGNSYYNDLCNNEVFMKYWQMFENHITSDKASTKINPETFYDDLKQFVDEKLEKEFKAKYDKLKTDRGRASAEEHYKTSLSELQYLLEQKKNILLDCVNVFNKVVDIKMNIFNHLKNSPRDYDSYLYKKTGEYEPTSGEGFSMSDQDGNIVKLVDRSEFAHANRSKDYLSGFEHESYDPSNMVNTVSNTDKDPSVIATKQYHRMKTKKLKPGQMIVSAISEELNENLQPFELEKEKDRIRDVLDILKDIEYGYISTDTGERITDREYIHNTDKDDYEMNKDPQVTIRNKLGICKDQALVAKYLMNKYHPEDKVVIYYMIKSPKGHCVPCYCHDGKWYYIENAWDKEKGLHGYFDSQDELKKYLEFVYYENHKNDTPEDSEVEVGEYRIDEKYVSSLQGDVGQPAQGSSWITEEGYINLDTSHEDWNGGCAPDEVVEDNNWIRADSGLSFTKDGDSAAAITIPQKKISRKQEELLFDWFIKCVNANYLQIQTTEGDWLELDLDEHSPNDVLDIIDNYYRSKVLVEKLEEDDRIGWIKSNGELISMKGKNHDHPYHQDDLSDIRYNFIEGYIGLPQNGSLPTSEQLTTLLNLLDRYFKDSIEIFYYFEDDFKSISVDSNDYTSDDVIKLIRRLVIEKNLVEKIVKKGSKWQVQSEKGRNMGTYDTKSEAEKRLKQVHYFKYKNEELDEDVNSNDRNVYNLVYNKLLDIAEDSRLRKRDNHKHYETLSGYIMKQYRGNKLSRTMFTKLSKLIDSYDKSKHEDYGDNYHEDDISSFGEEDD